MDDKEADRLRRAEGYQPDFDVDLAYGQQAEILVLEIMESIQKGLTEVKRDARWVDTGNVYIEYECLRGNGKEVKSGLAATKALLFGFVLADTECLIILPTATLKEYASQLLRKGHQWNPKKKNPYMAEETNGSHPTRGVKAPLGGDHGLFEWLRLEAKKRRGG